MFDVFHVASSTFLFMKKILADVRKQTMSNHCWTCNCAIKSTKELNMNITLECSQRIFIRVNHQAKHKKLCINNLQRRKKKLFSETETFAASTSNEIEWWEVFLCHRRCQRRICINLFAILKLVSYLWVWYSKTFIPRTPSNFSNFRCATRKLSFHFVLESSTFQNNLTYPRRLRLALNDLIFISFRPKGGILSYPCTSFEFERKQLKQFRVFHWSNRVVIPIRKRKCHENLSGKSFEKTAAKRQKIYYDSWYLASCRW